MSERNARAWPSFVVMLWLTAACTSPYPTSPTLTPRSTVLPSATQGRKVEPAPTVSATPLSSPMIWRVASVDPSAAEPDSAERSPDGEWTASSFGTYPPIVMQVARADGSVTWEITYAGEDWFEVWLRPVHWSVDGRYLYFTLAPFVDGFVLYMNGSGLQRLDLVSGEMTELLAGAGLLQSFSISPDSTQLVFFRVSEDETWLVLRDLEDGRETEWKLADGPVQAGAVRWSPDGTAFVLLASEGFSYEEVLTDVVLLDLRRMAPKTVLQDAPRIRHVNWTDANSLYLEDYDGSGWLLDLTSGEMVRTPTPSSAP